MVVYMYINVGIHLVLTFLSFSHGMSYPISGNATDYIEKGYEQDLPLIVSSFVPSFF